MEFVILKDWGCSDSLIPSMTRKINRSLSTLAVKLIKRMPICKSLPQKRVAFARYFIAYYRIANGKTYTDMFSPEIRKHVWSFALYVAFKVSYDTDDLEYLWKIHIGDKNGSK